MLLKLFREWKVPFVNNKDLNTLYWDGVGLEDWGWELAVLRL